MASQYRRLRAHALKAMFKTHAAIYELSDGLVGAGAKGLPMLLLSVTGRRSGQTHTTPLVYFRDGDGYVVVGSDGAAKRDPQWWKNLQVDPIGAIRVGRQKFDVSATLATGTERERLWEIGKSVNPMWERYQAKMERETPVVVLKPVA